MAQWCRDHGDLLRDVFGPRLFLTPCGSLYRWLLPQLDASAVERVLGQWAQATTVTAVDEPLADLVRITARKHSGKCAWTRKPMRSRKPAQVLPTLPIRQRVCTADALHTHAEFLGLIHGLGAETVLTVKGNQPTLYADLQTYFADPQAQYLQAETVDRRRGRTEVRTIKGSHEMNAYLAATWPFVAQVAQLTRTVTKAGKSTAEVVYLITTLTPGSASAGPPHFSQRRSAIIHKPCEGGLISKCLFVLAGRGAAALFATATV